ncbi:hypothetical protein [Actinomadura chokoriensis]|uniref:Uncharacterized protein n=1 Tax=Actinomadura chokoriensis TaxID=454156 RepID=A0ABV4R8D7_9ACTN
MRPLWWYTTGTPAKAKVERCHDPGKGPLTCSGTWTLPGGAEHRGGIAGAGKSDVGEIVEVRASASHAATLTLRLAYAPVLFLLVAALLGYVTYRQRSGARRGTPGPEPTGQGPTS